MHMAMIETDEWICVMMMVMSVDDIITWRRRVDHSTTTTTTHRSFNLFRFVPHSSSYLLRVSMHSLFASGGIVDSFRQRVSSLAPRHTMVHFVYQFILIIHLLFQHLHSTSSPTSPHYATVDHQQSIYRFDTQTAIVDHDPIRLRSRTLAAIDCVRLPIQRKM